MGCDIIVIDVHADFLRKAMFLTIGMRHIYCWCGYWWRRSLRRWKWFWKKEGERNGVFPRLHESQRLKHSSASPLGKGSVSHTPNIVTPIATVRLWSPVLWTSRPNFEKIQWLKDLGGCFYRDNSDSFLQKLSREASLRSFLMRLLCEASLRGFFDNLDF